MHACLIRIFVFVMSVAACQYVVRQFFLQCGRAPFSLPSVSTQQGFPELFIRRLKSQPLHLAWHHFLSKTNFLGSANTKAAPGFQRRICSEGTSRDPAGKFNDSPLSPTAKKAVNNGFGFQHMTPVQAKTVQPILEGKNLIVCAKTGTGKTLSFLLPSIDRLKCNACRRLGSIDMLVLSPVRELSMQISSKAEELTQHYSGIRVVSMTGSAAWTEDVKALTAVGSDIVVLVATPGRLESHIRMTQGFFEHLTHLQILVLDEVDNLLAASQWRSLIKEIINTLPSGENTQYLFYSATISDDVLCFMRTCATAGYLFVDMLDQGQDGTVPAEIEQSYSIVPTVDMTYALWSAIQSAFAKDGGTPKLIVIMMTARITSYYAEAYRKLPIGADVFEIHSRVRSRHKRAKASNEFRAATSGILFTSDVSSRGLDYPNVTEVIQVGAPDTKADYIHRLGRTGRAGKAGRGLLLLHEFEQRFLVKLANLHDPLQQAAYEQRSSIATSFDLAKVDVARKFKIQAYHSRINHAISRNTWGLTALEILRDAKSFAASIGALDEQGRPPALTGLALENVMTMGFVDINHPAVYINASSQQKA